MIDRRRTVETESTTHRYQRQGIADMSEIGNCRHVGERELRRGDIENRK
jgi:hypothetical protein